MFDRKRRVIPNFAVVLMRLRDLDMVVRRLAPVSFRVWLEPYYIMSPVPHGQLIRVRRFTKLRRRFVSLCYRVILERTDIIVPYPHLFL